MGGLSRTQAALAMLAGVCVLAVGFLAGSAIGEGENSPSPDKQNPARITTRQSSVDVPTLGEVKGIPALEVKESPAQATDEESNTPTYTPSTAAEEAAPSEAESAPAPAPAPQPEAEPEVTVAPNG